MSAPSAWFFQYKINELWIRNNCCTIDCSMSLESEVRTLMLSPTIQNLPLNYSPPILPPPLPPKLPPSPPP